MHTEKGDLVMMEMVRMWTTLAPPKSPRADYLLAHPKHFLALGLLKAKLNPNSLLLLRNLHQLVYPCKVADPA